MRALIVEDETAAAENLTYLLRKVAPEIEIAAYTEVSIKQSNGSPSTAWILFLWTSTFPTAPLL